MAAFYQSDDGRSNGVEIEDLACLSIFKESIMRLALTLSIIGAIGSSHMAEADHVEVEGELTPATFTGAMPGGVRQHFERERVWDRYWAEVDVEMATPTLELQDGRAVIHAEVSGRAYLWRRSRVISRWRRKGSCPFAGTVTISFSLDVSPNRPAAYTLANRTSVPRIHVTCNLDGILPRILEDFIVRKAGRAANDMAAEQGRRVLERLEQVLQRRSTQLIADIQQVVAPAPLARDGWQLPSAREIRLYRPTIAPDGVRFRIGAHGDHHARGLAPSERGEQPATPDVRISANRSVSYQSLENLAPAAIPPLRLGSATVRVVGLLINSAGVAAELDLAGQRFSARASGPCIESGLDDCVHLDSADPEVPLPVSASGTLKSLLREALESALGLTTLEGVVENATSLCIDVQTLRIGVRRWGASSLELELEITGRSGPDANVCVRERATFDLGAL